MTLHKYRRLKKKKSLFLSSQEKKIGDPSVEILEQENIIVKELCWNKKLKLKPPKLEWSYFHSINRNVIPKECFQRSQGHRSQLLLQHRSLGYTRCQSFFQHKRNDNEGRGWKIMSAFSQSSRHKKPCQSVQPSALSNSRTKRQPNGVWLRELQPMISL